MGFIVVTMDSIDSQPDVLRSIVPVDNSELLLSVKRDEISSGLKKQMEELTLAFENASKKVS